MQNIFQLINESTPKTGTVKLVAIDGRGGSGKSTFARLLADKLQASIVQTDDFAGWDNTLDWWPLFIEKVFDPICEGAKTLSYERSKWWENHHPEPVKNQRVTPIMILEGVSSLRKEFRPYISVGIFIDTPKEVCLQRGLDRDEGNNTGKSTADLTKIWEEWQRDENEYFARDDPMSFANFVITGTQPFNQL